MIDPDESQIRLDFEKYGLGHLRQKPPDDWTSSEIESWLDAFAKEGIAPVVKFPYVITSSKIDELLHKSYCRRCGRCCLPNPVDPSHPGVEVSEDELRLMRRNFHISHRRLKKQTHVRKQQINHPFWPSGVVTTIYMTLPCMFYNSTKKQCQVYKVRPQVCKIFPVKLRRDISSLAIDVRCDYGRDIYKSL